MGTLINRFNKLSQRDRRALFVLFLAVPIILFWYFVSRPLNDRLVLAQRVLETSRRQASELQLLLNDYVAISSQLYLAPSAPSPDVLIALEKILRSLTPDNPLPEINRTNLAMQGIARPGAQIKLNKISPKYFWEILGILNANNINIYEIDLTANQEANSITSNIKVWASAKD